MKVSSRPPEPPHFPALERYAALGSLPETAFDRLLGLAARSLRIPVTLITLGDAQTPWFRSGVGPGWRQAASLAGLHDLTLHSSDGLVVPDLTRDPRLADALRVSGGPYLRFYAGVPLITPDAQVLGTLCVLDSRPRAPLPGEDRATLTDLAALAVDDLELRLKTLEVSTQAQAKRKFQDDLTLSRLLQGVRDLTDLGLALEDLLARVADLTAAALGVDWVGLTMLEGGRAVTRSVWHSSSAAGFAPAALHRPGGAPVWQAAEGTAPLFVEDSPGQPGTHPELVGGGVRSLVSACLGQDGPVTHVMTLARLHRDLPWDAVDRQLVEGMVRTLRRSRAEATRPAAPHGDQERPNPVPEEVRLARRQAGALLELSQLLEEAQGIEQIAPLALAAVGRALGDGWLVLWRREGEVFRPLALSGSPPENVRQRAAAGIPASHYEELGVLAGQRVFLNPEGLSEGAARNGLRGTAVVPVSLRLRGQELILGAYRGGAFEAWSPFERDLLITAGRILTVGVERHLRLQDLAAAANTDPLTGLGNRRAFAASLEAELKGAAERGEWVGVVSIDLDGLKAVNDLEGHLRGDALLVEFARALRATFQHGDQTYRLGGDEYALVLPGVTPHDRAAVLSRVAEAVRQVRLAGFTRAGASAGLACFPLDGEDPHTLVEISDARMYRAKSGKRRAGGGQRYRRLGVFGYRRLLRAVG